MTLEQGQTLIGKRVSVKTKEGTILGGTLEFLGHNEHIPSWNLQATVDRMPIQNVSLNDIKIYDKKTHKFVTPEF
jgi:hypothetical protein